MPDPDATMQALAERLAKIAHAADVNQPRDAYIDLPTTLDTIRRAIAADDVLRGIVGAFFAHVSPVARDAALAPLIRKPAEPR